MGEKREKMYDGLCKVLRRNVFFLLSFLAEGVCGELNEVCVF